MTDEMKAREEAICKVAKVNSIGEVSDGFHTFNGLYEQRMILFAALVKAYKDKAWKSYRHEYGEYCFGGGWFIVGIDTPEGSYTYHYENKYWGMFDCVELPRAKHWDGHTEADAETRLMSLKPEPHEDAVSRKTILKFLDDWMSALEDNVHNQSASDLKIIKKDFEKLPSAQPEVKQISYTDCANAMLMMWMDKVLTDGEYNRIMDKLNEHEKKKGEDNE